MSRSERGQATVELVAFLPLVLVAGLTGAAIVAGQAAAEQAGQAAEAGAVALLQERDPREAARAALPPPVRRRTTIAVSGRRVRVTVRPRLPLGLLVSTATADAGPEASP